MYDPAAIAPGSDRRAAKMVDNDVDLRESVSQLRVREVISPDT
jgi:hypothetical protein